MLLSRPLVARSTERQITGQGRSRLAEEPQWRGRSKKGPDISFREVSALQETLDLGSSVGCSGGLVFHHLNIDDGRKYFAERVRIHQKRRVPTADHPTVGAHRVAHRLKCRAG